MNKPFDRYFLMTAEDAKRYAAEVLHHFSPQEPLEAEEIGDGNINYVFRVRSARSGRSLIIKQADTLLRCSGRPLDQSRSRLEAEALRLEGQYAPDFVPAVYRYDPIMAAISMEDISAYKNLRQELSAGRIYAHLAEKLSEFLAAALLPTTDLVADKWEKKKSVQAFYNPEMCDITENLVLTEPYYNYRGENVITAGNEAFVEETLYRDGQLHAEVGILRERFMNYTQALLHGDLHSGSIFANADGIKILDPEFAFYGPMGYDIGNVIGNLFFPWASKVYTHQEDAAHSLRQCIGNLCRLLPVKLEKKYDELVQFPLYLAPSFKQQYLDSILADAYGYAGTEIIRRTVGSSKVAELTSLGDPALKLPMERALIKTGVYLIKNRALLPSCPDSTAQFEKILSQEA